MTAAQLKHSLNLSTIIGVTTSEQSSGQLAEKQMGTGPRWDYFLQYVCATVVTDVAVVKSDTSDYIFVSEMYAVPELTCPGF